MSDSIVESSTSATLSAQDLASDFWMLWVGATIAAAFISFLVLAILVFAIPGVMGSIFGTSIEELLVLAGVVTGLAIGSLQGRVLRRTFGHRIWWQWIVASVIGLTVALFVVRVTWPLVESVFNNLNRSNSVAALLTVPLLSGALGGFILGCTQWLVLKRYVERASGWILGSAVAIPAGAASGILIVGVVSYSDIYTDYLPSAAMYTYLALAALLPWPIIAGVTGWTLKRLVTRPRKPDLSIWTQSTAKK